MSREEFTRLLGPYLDGELSEEQRETGARYLAGSEEYRKLAAEAEERTRLAKNDRPPEVSADALMPPASGDPPKTPALATPVVSEDDASKETWETLGVTPDI